MALLDINTEEEFNSLIKKNEYVVVHFWASWAPQCVHMNEVMEELKKKYENVTFAKLEAEELPEISENEEISAVPTFILYKSGKKFATVNGANAGQLSEQVESLSIQKPDLTPEQKKEQLNARLKKLINSSPLMVFMKGVPAAPRCKFSRALMETLQEQKFVFGSFNILDDDDVRQGLKEYSNWPTFPQIYIDGELIGGLDILKEMIDTKEIFDLLPKSCVGETKEELNERLKSLINKHKLMLFMKGHPDEPKCGFSRTIVSLFKENDITDFETFDILTDEAVRAGLKVYSEWPTFPQVYVKGELVGGLDIVREMIETKEFQEML